MYKSTLLVFASLRFSVLHCFALKIWLRPFVFCPVFSSSFISYLISFISSFSKMIAYILSLCWFKGLWGLWLSGKSTGVEIMVGDFRVVRYSIFQGPRFEINFRPATKCVERIYQLSVIQGKKVWFVMVVCNSRQITWCGHIERKDQGHTAQLIYLFSGPFVLCA